MKTKSAATKTTEYCCNARRSQKHLAAKIALCFTPDSRLYTLPLDLHRFNLSADLLHWHLEAGVYTPLTRAACYAHAVLRLALYLCV